MEIKLQYEPCHEKPVYATCEQQRFRPNSLISSFVVRCFDNIIPRVAKPKVSSLSLVSVAEQTGLSLIRSHTTEDRFSRDEAHMY